MAYQDIMPWNSPHGGHPRIQHYRLNAAETFLKGEPVAVNADGELTQSADDPAESDLIGIAAANGDTTGAQAGASAPEIYPTTAADGLPNTGDMIPVYIPDPTSLFITANHGTTSEQFDNDIALANLGDEAGLELVGDDWGINVGATNNTCRIVDLLDADKTSVQQSAGTVVFVVFAITRHQMTHVTAPDA